MKILTWNIQQGGGSRVNKVLSTILDAQPDTLVLTEFRKNPHGEKITQILNDHNLSHQSTAPSKGENTVFIASKYPFETKFFKSELNENAHRCLQAQFSNLNIFGFYFPQKFEKAPVFQFILSHLKSFLEESSLLIGDFNTGQHYLDEKGATFKCAELFDSLARRGWIDLWRKNHDRRREYSWFSRSGNGFRIDHAFASSSFSSEVTDVYYDHEPRESKYSDHSVLHIESALDVIAKG